MDCSSYEKDKLEIGYTVHLYVTTIPKAFCKCLIRASFRILCISLFKRGHNKVGKGREKGNLNDQDTQRCFSF